MIFEKLKKDIRGLAVRLLLAELLLGGLILVLNYFFDLEGFYLVISGGSFLKYEILNTIIFFVAEIVLVLSVVRWWQTKYLKVSRADRITELLDEGEGELVEFKSSLRWDYKEDKYNRELEKSVIKSIAGFLNASGGVLLVGVKDSKEILGLVDDFKTLPKANKDGWENHLNQLIKNFVGLETRQLIKIEFVVLENKTIAVVEIQNSDKPVYIKDGENEYFYVRTGNSTNAMTISTATEYISSHWKKKD